MEVEIYALFSDSKVILSPRDIARKLNVDKSLVNRHLTSLLKSQKLSVSRNEMNGDPKYRLGNGESITVKGPVSEEDLLQLLATVEETTAPDIAKKLLGSNKREEVSAVNSKLYVLLTLNRVTKRIDEKEAFPLWKLNQM